MLLTIACREGGHIPALLGQAPETLRSQATPHGQLHIFFADPAGRTLVFLFEHNPLALQPVESPYTTHGHLSEKYLNTRPYAPNAALAQGILMAFPEPEQAFPGDVSLHWEITGAPNPLPEMPIRLGDLLARCITLLTLHDADKYHWLGPIAVDAILDKVGAWTETHPQAGEFQKMRLEGKGRGYNLPRKATVEDADPEPLEAAARARREDDANAWGITQATTRLILQALEQAAVASVADLHTQADDLLPALVRAPFIDRVSAFNPSGLHLYAVAERLNAAQLGHSEVAKLQLLPGSPSYMDPRMGNHDALLLLYGLPRYDPERLGIVEYTLMVRFRPQLAVFAVTKVEGGDWDQVGGKPFVQWAVQTAATHGYEIALHPLGKDPEGHPAGHLAILNLQAAE